jgi:DNA-binding transcriptional LysR family regulator
MELRHLRYFVAVAEELHFRRAAERLHVAQPAVSEQIRKLEAELGVLLLHRTQRSVVLTEAGTVLLEDARRILRQTDAAQRATRRARDGILSRLRIGYVPDALPATMPRALRHLRASTPAVQVELEAGSARPLLADLRADRLDAVLVSLPAPVVGLRLDEVGYEVAVVAMASDRLAPGAVGVSLTLEELAGEPLLLMAREVNPAFYDAVVGAFRAAELAPTLIESGEPQVEHVLLEVAAGTGVALVPSSVADRIRTPGVTYAALAGEAPGCSVVLVTRDEQPGMPVAALLHAVTSADRAERRRELAVA